uniref:heparin cofactor 2 n=1 Tax=Myxine glutinosa TaxID=7769 RepID=UPI00358E7D9D
MHLWYLVLLFPLMVHPARAEIKDIRLSHDATPTEQPSPTRDDKNKAKQEGRQYDGIDHLDFEELFGESDNEDSSPDVVDEIDFEEALIINEQNLKDPTSRRAHLFARFRGMSRIQRLAMVNANFAFDLYRSVCSSLRNDENVLLSPLGISSMMGLVALGAKGETHRQIFEVMGFQDLVNASSNYNSTTVHYLFRRLIRRLFHHDFGFVLKTASGAFVQQGWPMTPAFKVNAVHYYVADVHTEDFTDPDTSKRISRWVNRVSKGRLQDAIQRLDPHTILLLLNCVYFKGQWEMQFPKKNTALQIFWLNKKSTIEVPMMQVKGAFPATTDNRLACEVVQLPFHGDVSMFIAVPHELSTGLADLEKRLSSTVLERWLKEMSNISRQVVIPKFHVHKKYNLEKHLHELGIKDLFEQPANLLGISSNPELRVDTILHQGSITVDEEGSAAAALTSVGFTPLTTQERFLADRPFLFAIYDHPTMSLLFVGRVTNPLKP